VQLLVLIFQIKCGTTGRRFGACASSVTHLSLHLVTERTTGSQPKSLKFEANAESKNHSTLYLEKIDWPFTLATTIVISSWLLRPPAALSHASIIRRAISSADGSSPQMSSRVSATSSLPQT
jgi:hypothetical protein